jgi:phosphinothricin acetyltransferase
MKIRLATEPDAAAVLAIYAPMVRETATSFEVVPPTVPQMAARMVDRQPAYPWLVAEEAGSVTGYAYAGPFAARASYLWSVETSVYLAEDARGKGVGRALYVALFELLTAQGYRRVMAGIALPNPASVALHEKLGFTPVGTYRNVGWKLGAWRDVSWWQRGLGTLEDEPPDPVPFTDLPEGALDRAMESGRSVVD